MKFFRMILFTAASVFSFTFLFYKSHNPVQYYLVFNSVDFDDLQEVI